MKLIGNVKATLTKSFVAWLVYAGMLGQLAFEFGLGQALPGWVVILLLVLVLIGRIIKQESVSGPNQLEEEFTGGETNEAR